LALVLDARIGPVGYARTAVAALLIAHHVPPPGAIDVAVRVGNRLVVVVHAAVVAGTHEVADLVRDRIGDGRTGVMHDEVGLLCLCADAGGEATAAWAVEHQPDDVGVLLVAQLLDVLEDADA